MEINVSKRSLKPYCLEGKNGPFIFKESIIILDLRYSLLTIKRHYKSEGFKENAKIKVSFGTLITEHSRNPYNKCFLLWTLLN